MEPPAATDGEMTLALDVGRVDLPVTRVASFARAGTDREDEQVPVRQVSGSEFVPDLCPNQFGVHSPYMVRQGARRTREKASLGELRERRPRVRGFRRSVVKRERDRRVTPQAAEELGPAGMTKDGCGMAPRPGGTPEIRSRLSVSRLLC